MKKALPVILSALFLFAITQSFAQVPPKIASPVFSVSGGLYESAQSVSISAENGATVFYTLDGSLPDKNSTKYTEPINVRETLYSPRTIQSRVAQERMPQGTVIRAIAITDDGIASDVVTNTYFVAKNIKTLFDVPVTNISAAPKDFWDEREGIYTNYSVERGVSANVEYFEADFSGGFSRQVEVKLAGHYSKNNPKKSIRIYFSKGAEGDKKYLEYNMIKNTSENLFSDDAVEKFGKITFRISDYSSTDLRDVVTQKIGAFTRADTANSNPCALFLNGEFLGIYACREQFDNRYVQFHYKGIDKDDTVMLKRDWTDAAQDRVLPDTNTVYTDRIGYDEGPKNNNIEGKMGEDYYRDLYNYTQSLALEKDITDSKVYAELSQYVDIDDFIDYLCVYVYAANDDWPGNNYILWRTTEESSKGHLYANDGKWRFMVHDFDIAYENVEHDTLRLSLLSKLPVSEARHPEFSTAFFGAIFKNKDFASRYAQRYAAYLDTAMSSQSMKNIVDMLISEYKGSKTRDLMRWNFGSGSSDKRLDWWKERMEAFNEFAQERGEISREQLQNLLNKEYKMKLGSAVPFEFTCDATKGSVSVSGALISQRLYGDKAFSFTTNQFADIPLSVEAVPNEGMKVVGYKVTHNGETKEYTEAALSIVPEGNSAYKVEVLFDVGDATKDAVSEICILREASFGRLETGKKWPVNIMVKRGGKWEKEFNFTLTSNDETCVKCEGNMLIPQKAGDTNITITCEGITTTLATKIIN